MFLVLVRDKRLKMLHPLQHTAKQVDYDPNNAGLARRDIKLSAHQTCRYPVPLSHYNALADVRVCASFCATAKPFKNPVIGA